MICRTDLALEAQEQWPGTLGPEELFRQEEEREGVRLSRIEIRGEKAAEALGRPVGSYITAQVPPLTDNDEGLAAYARVVGEELRRLLPEKGTVLVAGLGNDSITPDALGPKPQPWCWPPGISGENLPAAADWTICGPLRCWSPGS